MKQHTPAAILAVVVLLADTTPAYAYLDAGTGSMLLQLLLGGVGGALMVGKLYWQRLKAVFVRHKDDSHPAETGSPKARGE